MATDLLLTGEDAIRINSWCSVAGVTLAIEGRILSPDGLLIPIADQHTPNSDRSLHQSILGVQDGCLTHLSVRVSGGTVKRGQCFVEVELVRGQLGAVQALGILARDYTAAGNRLAWPNAPIRHSLDVAGVVRSIVGTDPAAGVEVVETVPTGARWRLRTFGVVIATSAVVANRMPVITIDDGANILWQSSNNNTFAAGVVGAVRAGIGVPQTFLTATSLLVPLPDELVLLAGWRMRTVTTALDAGDNYAAPVYSVEEWLEP